jgi:Fe-S cluster biosynthesis and repair protein YggX
MSMIVHYWGAPASSQLSTLEAIISVSTEIDMPDSCVRCSQAGEAPPAHRVPFPPEVKEKVLSSVCAACWKEWEGMEIKVINEYRLNFMDPQHRDMLQRTCLEFLNLQA